MVGGGKRGEEGITTASTNCPHQVDKSLLLLATSIAVRLEGAQTRLNNGNSFDFTVCPCLTPLVVNWGHYPKTATHVIRCNDARQPSLHVLLFQGFSTPT